MRTERIVAEFVDYRAYVSHTLVKHRLFLGLESDESARARLADASVWPLVIDEVERLLSLRGTLFGLGGERLEDADRLIRAACAEAREKAGFVLSGMREAAGGFRGVVLKLSDALSMAKSRTEREIPDFSAEAVRKYLSGRSFEEFLAQFRERVRGLADRAIRPLMESASEEDKFYRAFWELAPGAYLSTRCALVASAATGTTESALETGVKEAQRSLRLAERIVACWSPSVTAGERGSFLKQALSAAGFASAEAFVRQMYALGT